jgi:hypothetical protein
MRAWSREATIVLVAVALGAGCSGARGEPRTASDEPSGAGATAGDEGAEPAAEGEVAYVDLPACQALDDSDIDPLMRWIGAFPIGGGGAVLVFTGPTAEQMDVEAALEMAAVEGYEDVTCGTAVVVWVPGLPCGGRDAELARRVEEGTTMTHSETSCFRIDEVRTRIREECGRGTLAAEHCGG